MITTTTTKDADDNQPTNKETIQRDLTDLSRTRSDSPQSYTGTTKQTEVLKTPRMAFNHPPLPLTEHDDRTMMMMSLLSPSSKKERSRILESLRLEKSITETLGVESNETTENDVWPSTAVDNAINYIRCEGGDVKERQLRSDDKELVVTTVSLFMGNMILRNASDRLKDDPDVMQEALNAPSVGFHRYTYCMPYFPLEFVSERLRDDKEFILEVYNKGKSCTKFQYISQRLRDDPVVVETAIRNCCLDSPRFASARLQDDRDFYIHLMETTRLASDMFAHLSDRLKDDPHLVMMTVATSPWVLHSASTRLRDDRDFVMQLIERNRACFVHVSDRLKDDFEVAKKAGYPKYASARLRDDSDFILFFGIDALAEASDRIKNNKEIVLSILRDAKPGSGVLDKNFPFRRVWDINMISERLLCDKEVRLALLKMNREAIDSEALIVNDPLLNDPDIVSLSLAPMNPEFEPFTGRYWFSSGRDYGFVSGIYCYGPMRKRILGLDNEATKLGYADCDPWERIFLVYKVVGSIAGHDDDKNDSHHKNCFNLNLRRTIIEFAGLDKCVALTKQMNRHAEVRSAMDKAGLLSDEGWTKWESIDRSYNERLEMDLE